MIASSADVTKPLQKTRGYSFVPAAVLYQNYGGYVVYVKYKRGKDKIQIKQKSFNHIWITTPDRELIIVRNALSPEAFYPSGESFDEVVDFNLFNDSVARSLELEYIMTNFVHTSDYHNFRETNYPAAKRIQVLSDSGGLQLARGVTKAIHPVELARFYKRNTDAGMVLDMPLHFSDIDLCRKVALIQRKNIKVMQENMGKAELINIFHGESLAERQLFRKITETDTINRVAISRIGQFNPVSGVSSILDTIDSGLHYNQYHILGVYRSGYMPLMIKLANLPDRNIHITSDSTSHIQSAINKAYHFQFDVYHSMKRIPIGTRGSRLNTNKFLPCSCKVCRTIKYMDILGFLDNRFTAVLLSLHNAFEMARYARQLEEMCVELPSKEFINILRKQLKGSTDLREVELSLDFIERYQQDGLKAARSRYSSFLNSKRAVPEMRREGLFGEIIHQNEGDTKRQRVIEQMNIMKLQLKGEK